MSLSTNSSANTIEEVPFVLLGAAQTMSNSPRFGHSKDFSLLFSDENGDVQDYLRGIIFAGAFILAAFFTWALTLLIFKIVGERRVGFLSGAPFTRPSYFVAEKFKRPFRVRMTVLGAGIVFIIFAILLVVKGFSNLQETVTTFSNNNRDIEGLLKFAQQIANSLQSIGQFSTTVRDELVSDLGNFCPAGDDILELTGIDLNSLAQSSIDLLNQLGDFIFENVEEVQTAIASSLETSESVDTQIAKLDLNDWQSVIIIISFVFLPALLLVGLILSLFDISIRLFTCLIQWFLIPMLVLLVTVATVACSFLGLVTVVNSDFCAGGTEQTPDETVRSILRLQGFDQEDLVAQATYFYISQCQTTDPWLFLNNYTSQLEFAATTVTNLDTAIKTVSLDGLSALCGNNFTSYEVLLSTMNTNLGILKQDSDSVLELLSCERIVPIYTSAVYDGTCTYSIKGLMWTFSSFLIIAFMGMIMLTFRSAFYDDLIEKDDSPAFGDQFHDDSDPIGKSRKGLSTSYEDESFQVRSNSYDDPDLAEQAGGGFRDNGSRMNGNSSYYDEDNVQSRQY